MKICIYASLLSFMIIGCKSVNTTSTVTRDSIATRVVHHHDTTRVKPDSISIRLKDFLNKINQSELSTDSIKGKNLFTRTLLDEKNGRAELKVTSNKGDIDVKCKCDSVQIIKDFLLTDTTHYKFKTTTITRTVIKKVSSEFGKFCEMFFIIFCLGILGVTAFKVRKFFL